MLFRRALCLLPAILVAGLAGCQEPSAPVKIPTEMTLYSIDGRYLNERGDIKTEEKFHGHPVLGKLEVTDDATRGAVFRKFAEGMSQNVRMHKCFWPRHGIGATIDGESIDYVICFECHQVQVIRGGATRTVPTSRDAQAKFNKLLTDAGIPLAPGMKD